MSQSKPARRAVPVLLIVVAVLLVVCGGAGFALWSLVRGIGGLFATPTNPTNEPDAVHTFPGLLPSALAFSPDGNLLAMVSPQWRELDTAAPAANPPVDPPQLVVYDVTTGAKAFSATLDRWPRAVAFSPDGTHLAVGLGSLTQPTPDRPPAELIVYAVPGYAEVSRGLPDPACRPDRLEFSRDVLFTFDTDDGGKPNGVTAWRFPTLAAGPKLVVAMAHPQSAVVTPDGGVLIGGQDKESMPVVERFDSTGKSLGRFAIPKGTFGPVVALRHDPGRKVVTAFYPDSRQDFDPATGQPSGGVSKYSGAGERVVAVSGDGSRVALTATVRGSMAPDFRPWYEKGNFLVVSNLSGGTDRKWWVGAHNNETQAAFSADGKRVAAGYDGSAGGGPVGVRVWVSP